MSLYYKKYAYKYIFRKNHQENICVLVMYPDRKIVLNLKLVMIEQYT
jgi:hypothetical protein